MMQFLAERETLAPAVGEEAPDFTLPRIDSGEAVRLSSFRGRKPVALIFGSYT
jgi:peroxiredoxin